MQTQLQLLKDKHNVRRTCITGNTKIDDYFHNRATQFQDDNQAKTRVLKFIGQEDLILGFITTNVTDLAKQDLPADFVKKGSPSQGVPLLRLCYIGVNKQYQGKGYGSLLLQEVIHIAIQLHRLTGCAGIILDVVEEGRAEKIGWYQKFGFKLLEDSEKTMVLSIRTVLRILADTEKSDQ
jgi:ribosomal protein S18 acetylase RimI-like enzyme